MSPRQVYSCPIHGEFEVWVPFGEDVPETAWCTKTMRCGHGLEHDCHKVGKWVPSAPNFIGGPTTGAGNK